MKKILLFILIQIMCVQVVTTFAANEEFFIESITPSSVSVFVKTMPVRNLLQSVNGFVNSTFTQAQKKDLLSFADEFRTRTGIDFLNEAHLRRAGVDVTKPMAIAHADAPKPIQRRMIFIPVLDPKTAPLKMGQLLSPNKGEDFKPVLLKHNDVDIYRVDDMFFFAVANYCVIASDESFVKQAIDLLSNKGVALNADPMYQKYLLTVDKKNEINAYAKSDLKGIEKIVDLGKDKSAIEYVSFGFAINNQKIGASFGMSYKEGNPKIDSYVNILKSGNMAASLYNAQMLIYGTLSLEPEQFKPFLESKLVRPRGLFREIDRLNKLGGVNIADELVPNMAGTFNIYIENPLTGDYVAFMPMQDAAKTRAFMTKFQTAMKTKFEAEKRYGEVTMGRFWVRNAKDKRIFYASNARGVFVGTNSAFITKVMGFQTIGDIKTKDATLSKINNNTFMMARIRKNDLLGQFIMGQLSRHGLVSAGHMADLSRSASRIGDVFLTGTKKDNYVEVKLDIALTPAKK